jgi:hypothetical protein
MSFSYAWLVGLGILGLLIGLAQSLVLGRVLCKADRPVQVSTRWTATSFLGWTAGGMIGSIVTLSIALVLYFSGVADYTWARQSGYYVFWASFVLLGATVVSIFQERILNARINPAGRWTKASIVGWALAWAAGLGMAHITPGGDLAKGAVGGAVGGVVLGVITGHALVRLLAASQHESLASSG